MHYSRKTTGQVLKDMLHFAGVRAKDKQGRDIYLYMNSSISGLMRAVGILFKF
jgi:hypothetical protein